MNQNDSLAAFLQEEQIPANEPILAAQPAAPEPPKSAGAQSYDFRNPMLLSSRELRKLRAHQEEFIQRLTSRLSLQLRSEFSVKLTGLATMTYQKLAESWGDPAHLTLFKMEPLRGVSILEISSQLGLCMVDRLMGGPGQAIFNGQEISEIEKVLLDQTVQLLLDEWCGHWGPVKELKAVILGYESNGRFIQTAPPETIMLVISMEAGFGDCAGRMQLGFPYASLDSLIRHFSLGVETMTPAANAAPVPPPPTCKWNNVFDDVCVPVTAEWQGPEMSARDVLALKVGDILPMDLQRHLNVRLADVPKFQGRAGTMAGQWAVEVTKVIKR